MISASAQRKLIHLLLFVLLSLPFLVAIPLPIPVNKPTRDAYETVQSVPEGSIALVNFDFSTQSAPELYPQAYALLRHAIKKHFKFVIISFYSPDAVLYARNALTEVDLTGYKYGTDYVHLGYFPGGESTIAAFGRDTLALVRADAEGRSVDNMPLMQKTRNAKDFAIWLIGNYDPLPFVKQINAAYGSTLVVGCDSISYPRLLPYYQSGQFKGLLNGVRGGAEYEILLGYAGQATSIMNVQSFSHMFIIFAIAAGNVAYYVSRGAKKK